MKHDKINTALLWLACCVPLLLVVGRGAADVAMGVVSIVFLCRAIYHRDATMLRTRWFQLSLVIWVYLLGASAFALIDRATAFKGALAFIRFPLFAMAASTWLWPQAAAQKLLPRVLLLTVSVVAIDTLCQFLFGISLSQNMKPDYIGRLSGPFGDRLVVGVYLVRLAWPAIGLAVAWALMQTQNKARALAAALFFAALVGVTILLSGERIAFALFGLGGLVFWFGAKTLRTPLAVLGVICIAAMFVLVWFTPILHMRIINHTGWLLQDLSHSSYGMVWHNGMAAWRQAPIFGIGLGNFVPLCQQQGEALGFMSAEPWTHTFTCARHPHNLYLEWLSLAGVIGFALFVLLVGVWVRDAWRNLHAAQHNLSPYYIRLGAAVGLLPFLWPFMSSMSFFSNWSAVLFWWALSWVLHKEDKTHVA